MKTVNRICHILAVIFGLGSLVLFFMRFATIVSGGNEVNLVGTQLGFGSKITVDGTEYNMAISSDILFCFLLTAISFLISIFSFKSKKLRYMAPAIGIIDAVYMLDIEVKESNGSKKTIMRRVILFFRDYKSEVKKIVWPGWKEVIKNTVIVLIMCLLIGVLIWLIDFGLGKLLELILQA